MNSIRRTAGFVLPTFLLLFLFAVPFSPATFAARKTRPASSRSRELSGRRERGAQRSASIRRAAERRIAEARHRAEVARLAAIARQRAIDEAMRDNVQSMIAKDEINGEDPEIRRVAINALGNHAGTVVVMNPQTGQVYAIVNQQWGLREGFKPCSTIKLVTGLAGLNERVIDPNDTAKISDTNQVDLTHALAYSKNGYFQTVGGQVGFDKMISYARQLGLGEKTGINVPDEFKGRLPTSKTGFAVNHMSSHGDDFKVTALQLATLVSAMANGGSLMMPFVPRTPQDTFTSKVRRTVDIDSRTWQFMVPGMVGSVNYGSGKKAFDPQEIIAGKTGTCIESGTWVGLFTSYAPLKDPKLAVVVIARGIDGRNHFPAAVAGRIYRDLNGRFGPPTNMTIARDSNQQIMRADSKPSLKDVETNADGDEEEEGDDTNVNQAATKPVNVTAKTSPPKTIWGDDRKPASSKVQQVLMPLPQNTAKAAQPVTYVPVVTPQNSERPHRATNVRP